jgi:FkbM family methyltransferase
MLTAPLASAYRSLVPERIRTPLRKLRSTGQALLGDDRPAFRDRLRDFYSSIGRFRPVVRTAVGTRLAVDLRDEGVGWPIFVHQEYEPAETLFLTRSLRAGNVFVDIGANVGYFTTLASRLVGPRGKVIAFEPDPDSCALLRANLRRNGARNAVVFSDALGAEDRAGQLYLSKSNFGDHRVAAGGEDRQSVPISIRRFDTVCDGLELSKIDFIKIDVQGYEPQVFEGMGGCLERLQVRTILMEFWPYGIRYAGDSPEKLIDRLVNDGYVIHELNDCGDARRVEPREMLDRVEAMNAEQPLTFANLILRKTSE